jgi:hypothetical protein
MRENKNQPVRPIGFIGKDILAIEDCERRDLARDFRRAIDALSGMPDKTCNWCGVDLETVDDHKFVDRQSMCLDCINHYGLEEGTDYER